MILAFLPVQATLSLRATSLAQALPEVGRAFGAPMRAAPAIGGEIVILSLKAAPLDELKARLAATFAAEWRTEADGTLVLSRSTNARAAEERAFFRRRRDLAAEMIAKVRGIARNSAPITPALVARYLRAFEESKRGETPAPPESSEPILPELRLMCDLMTAFPPEEFTRLSDRVVFSNFPTPVQRPFPVEIAPLLTRFQAERRLVAQLELAAPSDGRDIDPKPSAPPVGPVRTVQLVVETAFDAVEVTMTAYDKAGRVVTSESIETSLVESERSETEAATRGAATAVTAEGNSATGPPGAPPTPDEEGYLFPASPETLAFEAVFGKGVLFTPTRLPIGNRERARPYLDTVARDPLGFALSDIAFEAGRLTGRSVIVRAADESITAGTFVGSGERHGMKEALSGSRLDLKTPGWLTVRPELPYRSALGFFPRPALREVLTAVLADGRLSLDTAARIAELAPDNEVEPPLMVLPMQLGFGRNYLNLRTLRIFAALGPEGRRRAITGVRVADLPPLVRERLRRLVFGPTAAPIRRNDLPLGSFVASTVEGLESEPTSLLPNGLPPDARLTVTTIADDGFVPAEGPSGNGRMITMATMANRVFQARNPRLFHPETVRQSVTGMGARLRRSGREMTTLRLDLTPRHYVSTTHQALDAPSGPEFTLTNLPPDLRAALDRAMTIVEARYRDAKPYEPNEEEAPPPLTKSSL